METRRITIKVKSCKQCPYMQHRWNAKRLFRCSKYRREITVQDQEWMEQNRKPFPKWCEEGIA